MSSKIDYFDHAADMGVIGRGDTLEAAFVAAALAVFSLMSDVEQIPSLHRIEIQFDEADLELALVVWLNALLSKARENNLIFSQFELSRTGTKWLGFAYGDYWQDKYSRGTEVKGATLTMLKVSHNNDWEARCVVDM